MKRIVSLLLVFVLVLSCFVGCENNVESNEVSSEIILDETRPSNTEARKALAQYVENRGYGIDEYNITSAKYDSATKICVVDIEAKLFEHRDGTRKHWGNYRFRFKLLDNNEWELVEKYPEVIGSTYMPDLS